MEEIINKLEQLIATTLKELNYELVDLVFLNGKCKKTLSVFIDKENGVNLKDCELASEKISLLLDSVNLIESSYILEVSSPGLNRVLKKENDFIKYNNRKIKVKLYEPLENNQKNITGYLRDFYNNTVKLECSDKKIIEIPLKKIAMARLEPEINL